MIEIKRKQMELERIILGKKQLEFNVEEKLYEIEMIKKQLITQNDLINKIQKELENLKGN